MASFYRAAVVLSWLVSIDIHIALADDVMPNVGGAGGPGAICFGGNFVVGGSPDPSIQCDGGKVLHPEVANYLLLKTIHNVTASSLASQDRFQKEMVSKLQDLIDLLQKHVDASNRDLRKTIIQKFDSLAGELRNSEPIIGLREQIVEELDKRLKDNGEPRS